MDWRGDLSYRLLHTVTCLLLRSLSSKLLRAHARNARVVRSALISFTTTLRLVHRAFIIGLISTGSHPGVFIMGRLRQQAITHLALTLWFTTVRTQALALRLN